MVFKKKNPENVRFVKVNSLPAVREHLTPKFYVDEAISHYADESSMLRLDPDEKLKRDQQDSIIVNSTLTSGKTIIGIPTKSNVDSLHENRRNRREFLSALNDQGNGFDKNKLTNLDSVVVNGDPSSDNELTNKKYVEDSIGKGTISSFN